MPIVTCDFHYATGVRCGKIINATTGWTDRCKIHRCIRSWATAVEIAEAIAALTDVPIVGSLDEIPTISMLQTMTTPALEALWETISLKIYAAEMPVEPWNDIIKRCQSRVPLGSESAAATLIALASKHLQISTQWYYCRINIIDIVTSRKSKTFSGWKRVLETSILY